MPKSNKNLKRLILALVVLAAGYLWFNAGGMIVRTAEKIASDALGVKVDIGSIDLALSDKTVTVNGLTIANPPGYRKSHAMTADSIVIGLNTASSELIDFKNIEVKGSVVNLEVNEKGMNLLDLKNLANRKEQRESVGSKQVRVIVQHMVIDGSVINPSISVVNHDISSINMPPIKMSGLGQGGNGMEAGDAVAQVMSRYLSAVVDAARDGGMLAGVPLPGLNDVKKNLNDAATGIKGLLR